MQFFTIGVYNSEEDDFFEKISQYGIDTFCDLRQRRGVRGARYTFNAWAIEEESEKYNRAPW